MRRRFSKESGAGVLDGSENVFFSFSEGGLKNENCTLHDSRVGSQPVRVPGALGPFRARVCHG